MDASDLDDDDSQDDGDEPPAGGKTKGKKRTVYGQGEVFPDYFSNTAAEKRTIRIDSRLLAEVEAGGAAATKQKAAEALRQVIDTVGKRGQPGEHVRCVVSVSMLTEGWDASNVTHILGIRAFDSQLLCEQVVGRGLRRMSYDPDSNGLLPPEYVDVYGIPFSIIPFKGRKTDQTAGEDKPRNHVYAVSDRRDYEIRFPVVEGYVYALRQDGITCDIEKLEALEIGPSAEPTLVWVHAARGYQDEPTALKVEDLIPQDREGYYAATSLQTILFRVSQQIVEDLLAGATGAKPKLRLQARHQLFPQVLRLVRAYVDTKVVFKDGVDPRELGLARYAELLRQRFRENILPAAAATDAPLLPVLNTFRPFLTTAKVDYTTIKPVLSVERSHINVVVQDSTWERDAAQHLEQATELVECYVRNDSHVGLTIPYDYLAETRRYEPDFIVRLHNQVNVMLEIKGYEVHDPDVVNAKNTAARKWVSAVNNLGDFGQWRFQICKEPGKLVGQLAAFV